MSIRIMSQIWDTQGHFTTTEKMILLKIADCATDEGSNAYPSMNKIAKCCELKRDCIVKNLNNIYQTKILYKKTRRKDGKKTSNMYSFNLPLLGWMVENPVDKPCISKE